jgi:hypothetical protein
MPSLRHRAPAMFLVAAGLAAGGCRSTSVPRPVPLAPVTTTSTVERIDRVLTCEEAGRIWLDAATELPQALAADAGIDQASSVLELDQRLAALVAERTDRFAGLGVEPGC